jgi:hypothetical protein
MWIFWVVGFEFGVHIFQGIAKMARCAHNKDIDFFWDHLDTRPGKHTKSELENGHRNSEFTH